jgi:hypothetical protein
MQGVGLKVKTPDVALMLHIKNVTFDTSTAIPYL